MDKIKYIGWFFQFLWQCLKDFFQYPLDCFNEIGLWKENYQDFKLRIELDNDEEFKAMIREIEEEQQNKRKKKMKNITKLS